MTHPLLQASWAGARIIQGQWTPQAEKLSDFLVLIFSSAGDRTKIADLDALKQASGVTQEEWTDILEYTSQVSCAVLSRTTERTTHPVSSILGLLQPRQLQVLWIQQIPSPCFARDVQSRR